MTPQTPTEQDAVKQAQLLRTALLNMATPGFREYIHLFALDLRMRFVALMAEGFTEAQALQIVIERKP